MDYSELEDMVQSHDDAINDINDNLNTVNDNFDQYTSDNDNNIADLQQNEGQLMFPLTQDTIDLIKEQIPPAAGNFYSGQINANGTDVFLPTGWTSSVGGTGGFHYTITHNLGTTEYVVYANSSGNLGSSVVTNSTNSVDIVLVDVNGSPHNWAFGFILVTN